MERKGVNKLKRKNRFRGKKRGLKTRQNNARSNSRKKALERMEKGRNLLGKGRRACLSWRREKQSEFSV